MEEGETVGAQCESSWRRALNADPRNQYFAVLAGLFCMH